MPSELRVQRNQERKERTRGLLLEAAAQVFVRKGYHQSLISDIVSSAGVGQGTFYRFFESKRAIYVTLLGAFFEMIVGEFSEIGATPMRSEHDYRAASLAAVRRVVARVERERDMALLFLRETAAIDREAEQMLTGLLAGLSDLAKLYLDQAMAQGHARRCNSAVVSESLVGIGLHLFQGWCEGRFGDVSLNELSEQVVDFAFRGIGGSHNGQGARGA